MNINKQDIDIKREKEKAQFVFEVIEKLPENYKPFAELKIISGFTNERIAAIYGLTPSKVRNIIEKIKKTINELWNIYEEGKTNPEKMKEFVVIIENMDKKAAIEKRKKEEKELKSVLRVSSIIKNNE